MAVDVRVCFLGDSFVAGVGDPRCLGWAGRLASLSWGRGRPITPYNLGIRRNTSRDVLGRWRAECVPRLPEGCDGRVVLSFGVNDTVVENDAHRVPPEESVANLRELLGGVTAAGWKPFVVGPPPIGDDAVNRALAPLDEAFADAARRAGVPYVTVLAALLGDEVWMHEVRTGDGAHPGEAGYDNLAALITPAWQEWL